MLPGQTTRAINVSPLPSLFTPLARHVIPPPIYPPPVAGAPPPRAPRRAAPGPRLHLSSSNYSAENANMPDAILSTSWAI